MLYRNIYDLNHTVYVHNWQRARTLCLYLHITNGPLVIERACLTASNVRARKKFPGKHHEKTRACTNTLTRTQMLLPASRHMFFAHNAKKKNAVT